MLLVAIVLAETTATPDNAGTIAIVTVMGTVVATFVGAIITTLRRADNASSDQIAKYKVDADELKVNHAHEVAEMENAHREELKRINEACRAEKAWMRDKIKDHEIALFGEVRTFFPPETHNA